jgi:hypothetical protein
MKPYYRPTTLDDVYDLAPRLRQSDVDEIKASSGLLPEPALYFSFKNGAETNTIIASDGEIIGMFGVVSTHDPLIGVPWMLCTDRLPEIRKEFLPQSLDWVKETNKQYPILFNYVDKRNTKAIRWLRYLGFKFPQLVHEFGVGKKPFYEFVRIQNV